MPAFVKGGKPVIWGGFSRILSRIYAIVVMVVLRAGQTVDLTATKVWDHLHFYRQLTGEKWGKVRLGAPWFLYVFVVDFWSVFSRFFATNQKTI